MNPLPRLSSCQVFPETVDDQFSKPLIPVFLSQLLLGEESSQLWRHLELRDQQADHVVGSNPLDERMSCVIRVLGLGAPQRFVIGQQADQAGVGEILELLLGYCHRTIRVVQPAAMNTETSGRA